MACKFFLFFFLNLGLLHSQVEYSLEEKVGQLFMISFEGEEATEELKEIVETAHIGGVVYFNFLNGELSRSQVRSLSRQIQTFHGIPRWIAVDQEGGRVQRLRNGFSTIPDPSFWSFLKPDALVSMGEQIGKELKEAGISVNFSPVLDLTNPKSTVLQSRTISSSADVVITVGRSVLLGFTKQGLIGVLKHFPGHGVVDEDSHTEVPITEKKFSMLLKEDLAPFICLSPDVDAIMTAHMIVKDYDPINMISFSSKWIDFIRKSMNFSGLIFTDSLVMDAVKKQYESLETAAICAIEAGADILLFGGETPIGSKKTLPFSRIKEIYETLLMKARKDPEFLKRIEESFSRSLYYKNKAGILPSACLQKNSFAKQKDKKGCVQKKIKEEPLFKL
jgi:beta-N-acetylhexosaminidase